MERSFYSNGKLLLTAEYAVLDGALSLALPTQYGQSMNVGEIEMPQLTWKSFDEKGAIWFDAIFSLDIDGVTSGVATPTVRSLGKILLEAKKMNPGFLKGRSGYSVICRLDFPRNWGLGSSSTLINNIAQWAKVDAFELSNRSFGGSGYDIACAQNDHPILYRSKDGHPMIKESKFDPIFKNKLYFVYLNEKQNSRNEIAHYSKRHIDRAMLVENISSITESIVDCDTIEEFETLVGEHERLLSIALGRSSVKESRFSDFHGAIKSLGAWGGDFVLATGNKNTPDYFIKKGYPTVIPYNKMILQSKMISRK